MAVGYQAGQYTQGEGAIAIGTWAGRTNQGVYSVAIGYSAGQSNQHANTIVLNASGAALNTATSSAFYVSPVRTATAGSNRLLMYNGNEIICSSAATSAAAKTFIIDHPKDVNKYLVHACLEGPESGVYYRGKGEIENNVSTTIILPDYAEALANDFTVQITPIYNGTSSTTYNVGEVVNNQFQVFGENGKFFWIVHGKRQSIDVEPLKKNIQVNGDGPYKWSTFNNTPLEKV
jgi:hypothetical protein